MVILKSSKLVNIIKFTKKIKKKDVNWPVYYASLQLRNRVLWKNQEPFNSYEYYKKIDYESNHFIATCKYSNEVLGTTLLHGNRLRQISVEPCWWGKGIGKILIKEVIKDTVTKENYKYLYVNSLVNSTCFYSKLGFKNVGNIYFSFGQNCQKMRIQIKN
tara:strand:- start:543 stop:1022 length:480 start_codon:yes stop_codon:yes gene_type:complete